MNKKTIGTLLGLGGWVAVGACSVEATHPPMSGEPRPYEDGGSSGGSGSGSGATGSDGSTDNEDAEAEGAAPFDAGYSDVRISVPTDAAMSDPTCNPNKTWGTPAPVPGVAGFGAQQPLVAITNDELTLAWVVDNGNGQGSVFYADRTSTSGSFDTPRQLMALSQGGTYYVDGEAVTDAGDTYFAFDRVTLSSDGLTLIGVAVGGLKMAEFTRTGRTAAFDVNAQESRYQNLSSVLMPGEMLGDPVLAANGEDLVYSKYGLSDSLTVYETFNSAPGQTWLAGAGDDTMALVENEGHRKHPTSMTGDRLTLFVWDEAGQAYGVIRSGDTSDFNFAVSFGDRFSIQVNGDCSRIYYVASNGSGGYSLLQADAM